MSEVILEEVRHMAMLSRLIINEDEERLFAGQFARILEHMNILSAVDTGNVEPLYTPVPHSTALREDKITNEFRHKEILANAPETDGDSFVVPRIV